MPEAVPSLLAEDAAAGMFAMDYLSPQSFEVWKAQDLAYQPILGRRLGPSGLAGQGAGDAPVLKNNQRKSNSRG